MRQQTIWRLAGLAAVLGGTIDLFGPLLYPHLAEPVRLSTYVLIDVLLLFGMLGVQSVAGRVMGWPGLVGFVIAVSGVLLVRSSAAGIWGAASYTVASAVWSIGMVVVGAALLAGKGPFRAPAALWIAAFVIGLAGLALKDQGLAHRLAGWCFALGFVAAGVILARTASRAEA
ncbi:hypothetical protein ASD38_08430 [Caulobacter sp. Root487D2Y]|jgi:hypothetical protein|uniref:hypothetical protein n=1 Tax=Caulobacter sp. Root487D2Y TaxID=1736547 RepID=UPI0006F71AE9|nr:hypothetical protein [Caulobacter sp. Root487D2Y]KQY29371.1 hypothetical protein ASD38_08430 [Caulobacter sp. Root487D2Y]